MTNVPNQREVTSRDHDRTHPELTPNEELHERRTGVIDAKGRRIPASAAAVMIGGAVFIGGIVLLLFILM